MNSFINLKTVFDWNYLTLYPNIQFYQERVYVFIVLVIFLTSIMLSVLSLRRFTKIKLTRRFLRSIATFLFLDAGVGLLFLLSRVQSLPYLNMRIWMLLWAFSFIIGAIGYVIYGIIVYNRKLNIILSEQEKRKYMPHKNS